jgi:hypothetical protein
VKIIVKLNTTIVWASLMVGPLLATSLPFSGSPNPKLALSSEESTMPGVLLVALLVSAVLTLLVCPIILALYRRTIAHATGIKKLNLSVPLDAMTSDMAEQTSETADVPELLVTARRRLKRLAKVYAAAGLACAGVLTLAFLREASSGSYTAPLLFFLIFSLVGQSCFATTKVKVGIQAQNEEII